MEIVMFDNSEQARQKMTIKVSRYRHWCRQMDLDVEDDENWNSFCEGQQG